jgi:hypothetical protein
MKQSASGDQWPAVTRPAFSGRVQIVGLDPASKEASIVFVGIAVSSLAKSRWSARNSTRDSSVCSSRPYVAVFRFRYGAGFMA